jgi:hypothetical protein
MHFRAIQVEPIIGSGERICIGFAIHDDRQTRFVPVLRGDVSQMVFGNQMHGIVRAVSESVARWARLDGDEEGSILEGWVPPLEGIFLMDSRKSGAYSFEECAKMASHLYAAFASA